MKSTGIIRRIDDLGRIVIPKEIRRTLRLREGDPMEIFTCEGGVAFKPYSAIKCCEKEMAKYATSLGIVLNAPVVICDKASIITTGGALPSKYKNKLITDEFAHFMNHIAGQYAYLPECNVEDIYIVNDEYITDNDKVVAAANLQEDGEHVGYIAVLNSPNIESVAVILAVLRSAVLAINQELSN